MGGKGKGCNHDKGVGKGKRNDWWEEKNSWGKKKNNWYTSDWKDKAEDEAKSSDETPHEKTSDQAKKQKK